MKKQKEDKNMEKTEDSSLLKMQKIANEYYNKKLMTKVNKILKLIEKNAKNGILKTRIKLDDNIEPEPSIPQYFKNMGYTVEVDKNLAVISLV